MACVYFYGMPHLYFIALLIPQPYRQWIDDIRSEMALQFQCFHALKTVPHITLQPPFKSRLTSNEVLHSLRHLKELNHPFTVSTSGFGSFDNRVAFIDVQVSDELITLRQQVNQSLSEQKIVPADNRAFHPHITLAHRDLHPELLPGIKHFVEQKNTRWSFDVNAVSLLIHRQGRWQHAGDVIFG